MTILSETTAFARSLLSRSLLRFGMVGSSATLCYLWAGHLLVSWARWPAPAAHGLAGLLALLLCLGGALYGIVLLALGIRPRHLRAGQQ